jgi:aerobic-type carbon monoxide dehydrogenase small subunit (CoxS/CutS family)
MLRPRLEQSTVCFSLDGEATTVTVWSDMSALEALRLATTPQRFASRCEMGTCGTCELHIDDVVTRVCLVAATRLDGCAVISSR